MSEIKRFWYITSIDNLKSIFQYGILCRRLVDLYTTFSEKCADDTHRSVQQFYKRFQTFLMSNISLNSFELYLQQSSTELKILKFDESDTDYMKSTEAFTTDISDSAVQALRKDFHMYVPLFFADNTPMLYNIFKENRNNICLLEINKDVIELEHVMFSNGNVASQETETYGSLEGFTSEEWEIIYSRHPAYWQKWKRIRSAEVLVLYKVPVKYIKSVSVDKDSTILNIQAMLSVMIAKLDIPVNNNLTSSGIC